MAETDGRVATARQRRPYCRFHSTSVGFVVGAFFLFSLPTQNPLGQDLHPGEAALPMNDSGICRSVDIRSTLESFEKLRGCRVVEGFVQVLLFDNYNDSSFANISFPELTEITDYLLLFRVNGLKSLSHMFPNLAVIRGQNLFFEYSLVIFEMSSLQDIGLHSLTDIIRGRVRIDKNPSLCFVSSVDWDLLTHQKGDNFIKIIRPENECSLCPGDGGPDAPREPQAPCPNSTRDNSHSTNKHLCWSTQHCQKVCPAKCGPNRACDAKGNCCDEKCLGGCAVGQPKNCTVCRNFSIGAFGSKQCMNRCPPGYLEHLGRRCITQAECEGMRKPVQRQENSLPDFPYKVFKNSCLLTCPKNYMEDYASHRCIPCKGRCKKECPAMNVDTAYIAKELQGCTHITGPLEIQIRGGTNIVNELEESMNMIEEIDGYLKVVRSFPLVSLNFLRSLKVITGKTLESDKYAFVVLDNQNLQHIWDWTNRTLTIGNNGRLFFHFNPKLCYYEIEKLAKMAKLPPFSELEVAPNSNGDKIACNVTTLDVTVSEIYSRGIVLKWDPFPMEDSRKLLGYVIYSIEAPYRNVSLYDGRDACGGDGWKVHDVGVTEEVHILTRLKPYTQYAFYVKTYTTATYRYGAQSPIQYFRTLPDEPTEPKNVVIASNGSDSFIITWDPPQEPNGNVTHYIVTGKRHEESESDSGDRNYCTKPLMTVEPTPTVETKNTPKPSNGSCVCEDNNKGSASKPHKEEEVVSQIEFEDALQNVVYVKRYTQGRKKRDLSPDSFPQMISDKSNQNNISNITVNGTNIWESFSFTVYGNTQLHVTDLHHFTFYHVNIQACRERESDKDINNNCSRTALGTARTRAKEGANNVTNVREVNRSLETITVTWDEPADPNGIILTYSIEYKSNVMGTKPYVPSCITRKQFVNATYTYVIKKLSPGKYSLRVAAVSHAGMGPYSEYFHFVMPESASSSTVLLTVFAVLFLLCISLIVLLYFRKKKLAKSGPNKLIRDVNPEYVSTEYVVDEWEVQRKKIELKRELGQGSFGMVYEGLARDLNGKQLIKCAVKTVNEHATNRERVEFLNEASVMKAFDTAHVVRLLGVVSQGQPTLVIMELMANGDLKSYLRSHRPDAENYNPSTQRQPPTLKRILQMAMEIADGMAYLSAKKFVHRDLAARNCMVAEDLTVKIGDFGMTRDIYETDYYRKGTKGLLPVRWMAPESLKDGVFTSSSDIWSYGVVLWEMATLASQPYQGLSNEQVLRYVIDGGVMERPENCPDKLYMLMQYCWKHKPNSRPTFLELCSMLIEDANSTFTQISFYHSSLGVEARNARSASSLPRDDPTTPLRGNRDSENFSLPNSEDESEELRIDGGSACIGFNSFPKAPKENSTLANGHVNIRPTNGIHTAQW